MPASLDLQRLLGTILGTVRMPGALPRSPSDYAGQDYGVDRRNETIEY